MAGPGFVLGFDLGGTKLRVAAGDRSGAQLAEETVPTHAEQGAAKAISRVISAGSRMAQQVDNGPLLAVGVATMGITEEDEVLMAPNVPGWEELALPRLMRSRFKGAELAIANDVKAAALAELRWGALQGVDTGIYLNLGTGFASALIVGGEVISGAHGAAGEIGSNLRRLHESVGAGQGRPPLEEFVGGRAIGEAARQEFGPNVGAGEVFRRAERGDRDARAFVEDRLREIAFHLCNLTIGLDPERIVVGGGMMASQGLILPFLSSYLERFVPFPAQLVSARFLKDAGVKGALALAVAAVPAR